MSAAANSTVRSFDVRLPVDLGALGEAEMTARVHAPATLPEAATVLFCVPGKSYGKEGAVTACRAHARAAR